MHRNKMLYFDVFFVNEIQFLIILTKKLYITLVDNILLQYKP